MLLIILAVSVILGCGFVNWFTQPSPGTAEWADTQIAATNAAWEVHGEQTLVAAGSGYTGAVSTSTILDAQGNYLESAARATDTVARSPQGPVNTYRWGESEGFEEGYEEANQENEVGFLQGAVVALFSLFLIGVVAVIGYWFSSKKS